MWVARVVLHERALSDTASAQEPQGDILVFLTGRDEIDACMQALADRQVE
jgi:HrpA-like RNA helicase